MSSELLTLLVVVPSCLVVAALFAMMWLEVGRGGHLVRDVVQTKALKLVDAKTLTSGVVVLSYEPSH